MISRPSSPLASQLPTPLSHLIEHWSYVSELSAGRASAAAAFPAQPQVDRSKGIPSALTRSRGIL